MELDFYKCAHCGQIIVKVQDAGVPVMCCGEKMGKLVPNSTEAAGEKHVPVVEVNGAKVTVKVGSVEHPATEAHYIAWVILATNQGYYKQELGANVKPVAEFNLREGEVVDRAYAYCNLHGLWSNK